MHYLIVDFEPVKHNQYADGLIINNDGMGALRSDGAYILMVSFVDIIRIFMYSTL